MCKHINIISWIFSDATCKIVLTVINIYDRVLYFPFCSRTIQNVSKWTKNYGHNHIIFHAFIKVMHSSFIQSRIRPPFPYVSWGDFRAWFLSVSVFLPPKHILFLVTKNFTRKHFFSYFCLESSDTYDTFFFCFLEHFQCSLCSRMRARHQLLNLGWSESFLF